MHIYCPAESLVKAVSSSVPLLPVFMSVPLKYHCVVHLGSQSPQLHITGGMVENSRRV